MTDLIFLVLGGALVGAGIFYAGHKTATAAFLASAKSSLTADEQAVVALFRKATGKAPAPVPAPPVPLAPGSAPSSTA